MSITKVNFAGIEFKNPVVLASGTCGFGQEFNEVFDIEKLGGISLKGLTLKGRAGNSGIRVYETPSGLMNSVGLENPGVEAFTREYLPWVGGLDIVGIVNVGGHSHDDYYKVIDILNEHPVDLIELNISCPNIKGGGMNFGVKTELAKTLVSGVRKRCRHKMAVKLSPNAEDIVELAKMCEGEGADGISLINTFLAMAIDIDNKKPVFENVYAGLSGPAIKPIALRMTHQVAKAVDIPVMGMGGIACWQDAIEYIMAGAALVQVGTASFIKTDMALDIARGIEEYMERNGINDISKIRGII
ncbi:MAG: dihydroorotate dehydrogenase [Christensenellales bacterium]